MLSNKYKYIFLGKLICLILSAVLFFILYVSSYNKNNSIQGDIVFILDVSHSMNALDIEENSIKKISRLEVSKKLIKDIMNNNTQNRFGLILFSQKANYFIPPTYDQKVFSLYLDKINTNSLPAGGTNVYEGLKNFVKNSNEGSVGILISDLGEDKDIQSQKKDIELLKDEFIRKKQTLSIIGVGTLQGENPKYPSGEILSNIKLGRNEKAGEYLKEVFGSSYSALENDSLNKLELVSKNNYTLSDKSRKYIELIAAFLGALGIG